MNPVDLSIRWMCRLAQSRCRPKLSLCASRSKRMRDRTGEQSAMSPRDVTMPVWHEKHLRAATRAAGVALWSWNVDTDAITMDERAYELWGVPKHERKITFEILSKNNHPADLERVRSAFAATRAVVVAYEIDFRILFG